MRQKSCFLKPLLKPGKFVISKYLGTLYGLMAFIAEERKKCENGIDLFQGKHYFMTIKSNIMTGVQQLSIIWD